MKYCEDCKWFDKDEEYHVFKQHKCSNEAAFWMGNHFVSRESLPLAEHARQWGKCELEGKLWEGKE